LIFSKVALEWDEEKFSGAASNELVHYPGTQGAKAKILECKFSDFIPDKQQADLKNTLFL
jgi:hypothetical protein